MHACLQQPESPETCSFLKILDLCGKKVTNCPIGESELLSHSKRALPHVVWGAGLCETQELSPAAALCALATRCRAGSAGGVGWSCPGLHCRDAWLQWTRCWPAGDCTVIFSVAVELQGALKWTGKSFKKKAVAPPNRAKSRLRLLEGYLLIAPGTLSTAEYMQCLLRPGSDSEFSWYYQLDRISGYWFSGNNLS